MAQTVKHGETMRDAVLWARAMIADPRAVYLDTETTGTGTDDSVIEVAVINNNGEVLLDTLVYPANHKPVPEEAVAIHGIDDDMLVSAPSFREVADSLRALLGNGNPVVVYNAAFDVAMIQQDMNRLGIPPFPVRAECAMLAFAAMVHKQHGGRWIKLDYAFALMTEAAKGGPASDAPIDLDAMVGAVSHRAHADAERCRQVVLAMSRHPLPPEQMALDRQGAKVRTPIKPERREAMESLIAAVRRELPETVSDPWQMRAWLLAEYLDDMLTMGDGGDE